MTYNLDESIDPKKSYKVKQLLKEDKYHKAVVKCCLLLEVLKIN